MNLRERKLASEVGISDRHVAFALLDLKGVDMKLRSTVIFVFYLEKRKTWQPRRLVPTREGS